MAIGSELSSYHRSSFRRAMEMFCGTIDLHSHIRIRPLVRLLLPLLPREPVNLIEFGCGTGLNLFELAKVKKNILAEGYDLDESSIKHGERIRKDYFPDVSI